MKKLINDPRNVVEELFTGFVAMHHPKYRFVGDAKNIVVKSELKEDRVMLLIGGGSGHEPCFWSSSARVLPMECARATCLPHPLPIPSSPHQSPGSG